MLPDSDIQIGLKAFRRDEAGDLRYLFHAHEGTSRVQVGHWQRAKRRWVNDGQRQSKYRSGFHFLQPNDTRSIERFQRITKHKYVLVPVVVRGVEPKPRSSVGSWLAKELLVLPD